MAKKNSLTSTKTCKCITAQISVTVTSQKFLWILNSVVVCFHTGEENKLIPFVAKMCRLRATVANLYGGKKKGFKVSPAFKEGEKRRRGNKGWVIKCSESKLLYGAFGTFCDRRFRVKGRVWSRHRKLFAGTRVGSSRHGCAESVKAPPVRRWRAFPPCFFSDENSTCSSQTHVECQMRYLHANNVKKKKTPTSLAFMLIFKGKWLTLPRKKEEWDH